MALARAALRRSERSALPVRVTWKATGLDYPALVDRLAEEAAKASAEAEAKTRDTDALFDMSRDEYRNARRYKPRDETRIRSSRSDSIVETFGKSLARQLGTKSGQAIVRGVLGSLFRGR